MKEKISHIRRGSTLRKVLFTNLCILGAVAIAAVAHQLFFTSPQMVSLTEHNLTSDLNHIATELNSVSRERTNLAINLARRGEFLHQLTHANSELTLSKEETEKLIGGELAELIESFPFIIGGGIFYEPFVFDSGEKYRGFYARWVPPLGMTRKVEFTMSRSTAKADYHNSDWYRALIPSGWNVHRHLYSDVGWTSPYRDPVTLVPMISVLSAMYGTDTNLIGLASIDWNLDELTQTIDASRLTKNAIAMLFSANSKKFAAVAGLEGLNLEPINEARWMPYLLVNAPADRFEMVKATDDAGLPFRVYSRSLDNGLIYSQIIPEHEIFREAKLVQLKYFVILGLVVLTGAVLCVITARHFLRPMAALSHVATRYADGDFNDRVIVRTGDDLETISDSFSRLRDYIQSITRQSNMLSQGDLWSKLSPLSPNDKTTERVNAVANVVIGFAEELAAIHAGLTAGDTHRRFDLTKYFGSWLEMARNINRILDIYERNLTEIAAVCEAGCEPDSWPEIHDTRAGTFENVRLTLNQLFRSGRDAYRRLRTEIEALSLARDETTIATRSKSELLAVAAKEIQANIHRILSTLTDVDEEDLSPGKREMIKTGKASAGEVLALTDELLSYARINDGTVQLTNASFDLHRLLFGIKDILRPHVVKRRLDFRFITEKDVPTRLYGDEKILGDVLLSIISDSLLHTAEDGSLTVAVAVQFNSPQTIVVSFSISDTGATSITERRTAMIAGLTSGDSEKIIGNGGLTMFINRRLIELMGGSLEIESHIGIGTRCRFAIPFLRDLREEESTELTPGEIVTPDPNQASVLVVEDNVASQRLASILLKRNGCRVRVAGNGEEALQILESEDFDLVLMDLQLPVLNGIETTHRIRSSGTAYASIPIVAVTGQALRFDEKKCVEYGLNGFLLKPFEPNALRELLTRMNIRVRDEAENIA